MKVVISTLCRAYSEAREDVEEGEGETAEEGVEGQGEAGIGVAASNGSPHWR